MKSWSLSIGLYPGILLGLRTYYTSISAMHVLYLPLVELCLEVFEEDEELE